MPRASQTKLIKNGTNAPKLKQVTLNFQSRKKPTIKAIRNPQLPSLYTSVKQPNYYLRRRKENERLRGKPNSPKAFSERLCIEDINTYLKDDKKKRKRGRQKKSIDERLTQYQKDFPWLKLLNGKAFCTYCKDHCRDQSILKFEHQHENVFIFTGSTQFKKDAFVKHSVRELHCRAVLQHGTEEERIAADIKLSLKNQKDLKTLFKIMNFKAEDLPLLPIFRTVYFCAKTNLNLVDCERLCSFLELNDVKICAHYRNQTTLREILSHISGQVQEDHLQELQKCHSLGLQIDESCDISSNKILTLNVKYVLSGKVCNKFLCARVVKNGESETIFQCIKDVMSKFGLYMKIKSISTDGAKALISSKNGVVAKLRRDLPGLISIHCIAHRLNLGVSDSWKGDAALKELNSMVYSLCKLFRKAPAKLQILKNYQMDLLGYEEKLVTPIDIRWLTKFRAIDRILKLYPFIILALTKLSANKDQAASSLLKQLKEFKVVAHFKILLDMYEIIDPLNEIFQRKVITVEQLKISYTIAVFKLRELTLCNNYGPNFEIFIKTMPTKDYRYFGCRLEHSQEDFRYMKRRSQDLAKLVLFNLETRFNDIPVLEDLEVMRFDRLNKLSAEASTFRDYGNKEMKSLSQRYNLNTTAVLNNWYKLKILKTANRNISENDFWALVTESHEFQNIHGLIETFLTVPLSTVECERTFSKVNLIKSKDRATLSMDTIDRLLEINIKGPELNEFNFEKVISDWKEAKQRRFI